MEQLGRPAGPRCPRNGETQIIHARPPTSAAPRIEAKRGRNRQRFDLTLTGADLATEVDRLVSLGATRLSGAEAGAVELADPDGNEFYLRPG